MESTDVGQQGIPLCTPWCLSRLPLGACKTLCVAAYLPAIQRDFWNYLARQALNDPNNNTPDDLADFKKIRIGNLTMDALVQV